MDRFLLGTIILAIQTRDAIHVGIDSKVIAVREDVVHFGPRPKIHLLDDVLMAHVGVFKGENFDVVATAQRAIRMGGSLDQVMDRFADDIQPPLLATLNDIRTPNPDYFRQKMKEPLTVLFASMQNGAPISAAAQFTVNDTTATTIELAQPIVVCCPAGSQRLLRLGEYHATDGYFNEDLINRLGPVEAIREAIRVQAEATPAIVALPAVVWSIDRSGIHEVARDSGHDYP